MVKYRTISSVRDVLDQIQSPLVFDLETTSTDTHSADTEIVGVGLSWKEGEAFYVHQPDRKELKLQELEIFNNSDIELWGHNLKFDARMFHAKGIKVNSITFDSMIANYCLIGDRMKIGENSIGGHSLDNVSLHLFNHVKIRTKSVIPNRSKSHPKPNIGHALPEQVSFYCCEDVDYTLRACNRLKELLDLPENMHCKRIFEDIEMPLLPIIIQMECSGVKIDREYLDELEAKYELKKEEIRAHLSDIAGEEIPVTLNRNIIEKVIYDTLKVDQELCLTVKATPNGSRPVNAATLEKMTESEFVREYLRVKGLDKLISTYIKPMKALISPVDDMLHGQFTQTRTSTGRLASKRPNLQNIPKRTEEGRQIRKAFISRFKGGQIMAADWAQCELRIMAHLAKEKILIDIFERGGDPHLEVSAKLNQVSTEEITEGQRAYAKNMNFGVLYRMGPSRLAASTGLSYVEAQSFISSYLGEMRGIAQYQKDQDESLERCGYAETLFGRRRYLTKIFTQGEKGKYEREAARREGGNHPIQGCNADIAKLAMIKIGRKIQKEALKSIMILQVHDEIVIDTHPDEFDIIKPMAEEIMSNIIKLVVPLVCDGKYADNWAEAH
jgi:DNA polymerase-1